MSSGETLPENHASRTSGDVGVGKDVICANSPGGDSEEVEKDEGEEEREEKMSVAGKVVKRSRISSLFLQDLLLHVPEMNLPWQPLRSESQCLCGHTFSFTSRKVCVMSIEFST